MKVPGSGEEFFLDPATVRRNDRSAQSIVSGGVTEFFQSSVAPPSGCSFSSIVPALPLRAVSAADQSWHSNVAKLQACKTLAFILVFRMSGLGSSASSTRTSGMTLNPRASVLWATMLWPLPGLMALNRCERKLEQGMSYNWTR